MLIWLKTLNYTNAKSVDLYMRNISKMAFALELYVLCACKEFQRFLSTYLCKITIQKRIIKLHNITRNLFRVRFEQQYAVAHE